MTDKISAPGAFAGSADWKAYALRVQLENEELRNELTATQWALESANAHNPLEDELAAIKAEIAAAGKELPECPKAWIDGELREHAFTNDFKCLRESAIALLATREATIRELEAKCAALKDSIDDALVMIKAYHILDNDARAADGGVK